MWRLVLPALVAGAAEALTKPNIVLLVADDLGYADLGFKGSEIKTPNIDDLALNGRVLENYYVQSSCSPTRTAFHTGRYPTRINMDLAMLGGSPRGVPLDNTMLPQVMKRAGYVTHAVGKWHLGAHAYEFTPTFRGYDSFLGYLQGGESYWTHEVPWFIPHWLDKTPFPLINQYDFLRQSSPNCGKNCSVVEVGSNNHYSTHLLTAEAERIITAHDATKPFFMYLAYQAVHGPTEAPDSYVAPYLHIKDRKRQVYCGMLAALDEGVGNVTRALKASGLWDNTLLVFTTDNGGPTDTCDPQGSNNGALKKGKCSLYEGGVRGEAFITGGVNVLPAELRGKPISNIMHAVDWLPTFASLIGLGKPGTNQPLDGVNQHQALISVNATAAREDVFLGFSDSNRTGSALRMGQWKFFIGPAEVTGITSIGAWLLGPIINDIKTHNYTYLNDNYDIDGHMAMLEDNYVSPQRSLGGLFGPKEQLFDVTQDIGEKHNVAWRHPEVVKELRARLQAYGKIAPPAGTDPALSPECTAQKPKAKVWNTEGPDGECAMLPYCQLKKEEAVFI